MKCPSSKKRHQEIVDTLKKKAAAIKEKMDMTQGITQKAQNRRENAAATEANRTLEEAEAQEIERRSMKCSSIAANERGGYSSARA